ncbi:MAG TPA: DUF58 domain-containing protein [Cytophagaceae bacterium]|jgi:uncharacterized protein (DUF58 family)|nr:DUF58 domain-containing protein [Cytophagaceae bacterium]
METAELLKKVRKIEIKTRGLSNQVFAGEFHSAFKGRGMAFSEVREYQPGDDIRTIDWNVTARFNHPYIKVFEEERELTVMLIVDVSASEEFGTTRQFKKDLITELCAVLAFSAIQNNDKIGVLLFTDRVEKFIPPKKGKSHILRIIRELLQFKPLQQGTDISNALRHFNNVIKKKSITFVISDFMSDGFEDALNIVNRKHDLVALRIFDNREAVFPDIGLVWMKDAESGKLLLVDTSSSKVRNNYASWWKQKDHYLTTMFAKNGIDVVKLRTDQSYVEPLMTLFKKREKRF